MLRFFRTIRKTLMEQNKIRSYLFYAIGEIALVMIGILLALQINNWNESRKDIETEQRYKHQILGDLRQDSLNLSAMKINSDQQINSKALIEEFLEGSISTPDSLFSHFNSQWAVVYAFNPITRTIDEITSSGSLNVIRDQEIRDVLLHIYNMYENFISTDIAAHDDLVAGRLNLFYREIPNLYSLTDEEVVKALSDFRIENTIRGNSAYAINNALTIVIDENTEALETVRASIKENE